MKSANPGDVYKALRVLFPMLPEHVQRCVLTLGVDEFPTLDVTFIPQVEIDVTNLASTARTFALSQGAAVTKRFEILEPKP